MPDVQYPLRSHPSTRVLRRFGAIESDALPRVSFVQGLSKKYLVVDPGKARDIAPFLLDGEGVRLTMQWSNAPRTLVSRVLTGTMMQMQW